MDGKASLTDMRIAYGWAQVPAIWLAPLSILTLVITGADPDAAAAGNPAVGILMMVVGIAMVVLGIWSFVIVCKAVGEAHLFSAWAGFASLFLAGLLVMVPILAIVFAVIAASGV